MTRSSRALLAAVFAALLTATGCTDSQSGESNPDTVVEEPPVPESVEEDVQDELEDEADDTEGEG